MNKHIHLKNVGFMTEKWDLQEALATAKDRFNLLAVYPPDFWKSLPNPLTHGLSVKQGAGTWYSRIPESINSDGVIGTVNAKFALEEITQGGLGPWIVDVIDAYGGVSKLPFVNDVNDTPEGHHIIMICVFFHKNINEIYYDGLINGAEFLDDLGEVKVSDDNFWDVLNGNAAKGKNTPITELVHVDIETMNKDRLYGTGVLEVKLDEIQEIRYYMCDTEKLKLVVY